MYGLAANLTVPTRTDLQFINTLFWILTFRICLAHKQISGLINYFNHTTRHTVRSTRVSKGRDVPRDVPGLYSIFILIWKFVCFNKMGNQISLYKYLPLPLKITPATPSRISRGIPISKKYSKIQLEHTSSWSFWWKL